MEVGEQRICLFCCGTTKHDNFSAVVTDKARPFPCRLTRRFSCQRTAAVVPLPARESTKSCAKLTGGLAGRRGYAVKTMSHPHICNLMGCEELGPGSFRCCFGNDRRSGGQGEGGTILLRCYSGRWVMKQGARWLTRSRNPHPHWGQAAGREELPLGRRRAAELSYFSYSFLESPKKQLLHRSPSKRALGAEGKRITSLCS